MIIFVGVAGSGKSVQGKLLAQEINAKYFSMGEFLRQHLDPVIQEKMLTGELISDREVIEVIDEVLPKAGKDSEEYILDGFPRTIVQADWLISQVERGRFFANGVINLQASPEAIVPRLLERKRQDDTLEVISHRIEEYNNSTLPILEHLKKAHFKIHDINAERTIEEVHASIMESITRNP